MTAADVRVTRRLDLGLTAAGALVSFASLALTAALAFAWLAWSPTSIEDEPDAAASVMPSLTVAWFGLVLCSAAARIVRPARRS